MLFCELYKIMENKVIFVGVGGADSPPPVSASAMSSAAHHNTRCCAETESEKRGKCTLT